MRRIPRRRPLIAPAMLVAAVVPRVHPVYERIYGVVRAIPLGRVASYGQVAELAGLPGRARQVGYALNALPPGSRVPWQRIVNSQGRVSQRAEAGAGDRQRALLEAEGVVFDGNGRIDVARFGWRPGESIRFTME